MYNPHSNITVLYFHNFLQKKKKKKKKAPSHKKRTKVVRKENYEDEVDWIVHHQFITPSRIKELLFRYGIVSWIYLQITGFN